MINRLYFGFESIMNHRIYQQVLDTFEWNSRTGKRDEIYLRLIEIAEILEAPQEVMQVLNCVKLPTMEQREAVAKRLAQLATQRHFEL